MNTYSRALRYINMKDVKQKHQQKLIERKLQEEKKKEEEKYIQSVMKEKKYDWRNKLNEQMITSDVFFTTLPAVGDVDLDDGTWGAPLAGGWNDSISGNTVTLSGDPSPYIGNSTIRSITGGDEYDTLVIDVTSNGTPYYIDNSNPPYVSYGSGSSSRRFVIPFSKRLPLILFTDGGGTVTFTPKLQRRSPKNVVVSLDSPEATAFIRTDPIMANLSPQERQQKLKEMLEASDEYVMKALGLDFPGTGAVPPGEYDPFAQTPPGEAGDTPGVETIDYGTDLTPLSDNPYGTEMGQISQTGLAAGPAIKFMQDLMKDGFGGNQVNTTVNGRTFSGYPAQIINQIKSAFPGGV